MTNTDEPVAGQAAAEQEMKWYGVEVRRTDDPDFLIKVQIQGRNLRDAQVRLAGVLFVGVCDVDADSWAEVAQ